MKKIEFEDYTGKYPCLCMGVLTLRIDGEKFVASNLIRSGGSVGIDPCSSEEYVKEAEWDINDENLPAELKQYREQILAVINENIPHGCCGGCI